MSVKATVFLIKATKCLIVALIIIVGLNLFDFFLSKNNPQAYKKYSSRHKKSSSDVLADFFQLRVIEPMSRIIQRFIKLDELTKYNIERSLERAGMKKTAEEYYGNSVAAGCLMLPFFLLGLATFKTWLMALSLLIGGLLTAIYIQELPGALKEKKEAIESNLPKFIRTITSKIINDNGTGVKKVDLISTFEDYSRIADPVFKYDVDRLLMDMNIMPHDDAFTEFDKRINLADCTQLVAILKAVERGEDQAQTLQQLSRSMETKNREMIRRRLETAPKKIRMITYFPAIAGAMTLIYVMVVQIVWSMQDMF